MNGDTASYYHDGRDARYVNQNTEWATPPRQNLPPLPCYQPQAPKLYHPVQTTPLPPPPLSVTHSIRPTLGGPGTVFPRPPEHSTPPINRYYRPTDGAPSSSARAVNHTAQTNNVVTPIRRNPNERDEVIRKLFLNKNVDLTGSMKLGSGRYSKVVTCKLVTSKMEIAMKIINTHKVTEEFRNKFLPREIECWKILAHPNLVRILGHYQSDEYVFLTMERCLGGNMLSRVKKHGPVEEKQAGRWIGQVLDGVAYMHEVGVAHRDLKLENIMIYDEQTIKIGDFGFSRQVKDQLSRTFCGSKSYSAPEILKGEPYSPFKADVWSIGVIAFVIVTDRMPFRESIENKQFVELQRLRQYSYPSALRLSDDCRNSIDYMMTFDWFERPQISQCRRLPFVVCTGPPPLPSTHQQ